MEQNQSVNKFVEKISKELKEGVVNGKLENSILSITKDSGDLTYDQYVALGNLCYYVGIDMTGNEKMVQSVVENFRKRFTEFNFTEKTINHFSEILGFLNPQRLENIKEEMKSYVGNVAQIGVKEMLEIRPIIVSLFKNSQFPVSYGEAINDIINQKIYTYESLLNINNLLNEVIDLNGSKISSYIKLYKNEAFGKLLQKAISKFDETKFAVLYLDSICSVIEFTKNDQNRYFLELLNDEVFRNYVFELPKEVEQKNETVQKVTDEKQIEILKEENPKQFVIDVLKENFKITNFDSPEVVISCLIDVCNNPDLVQHLYHYMKAKAKDAKIVDLEEMFGFDADKVIAFETMLVDIIGKNRENIKKYTEEILQEIPEDKINKIIQYVNDFIKALVIEGKQAKGFLISQVGENGISTYYQLQQILNLAESQKIPGDKLYTYIVLVNYMENMTNIKELFQKSANIEAASNVVSFLIEFKNLIFGAEEVVDTETTKK